MQVQSMTNTRIRFITAVVMNLRNFQRALVPETQQHATAALHPNQLVMRQHTSECTTRWTTLVEGYGPERRRFGLPSAVRLI